MQNFVFGLLILIIAAASFFGCDRQRTLSPYHWLALGGEFDSLTNTLEWQFNDYVPFDSIMASIEKMDSLAQKDSVNPNVKRLRHLYWKARFLSRIEEHDSSIYVATQALDYADSTKYKYDYYRLLCLIYSQSDTANGARLYRFYEECLNYARSINDIAFEGYSAVLMANLMDQVGDYQKALHYLKLTDSLHNILGFNKLVLKNKINWARVLERCDKKDASDSILKNLIEHPLLSRDTFVINLIPRNLYGSTNDIKYLYQANDQIKNIERFRHLRGLYSALLLKHNFLKENFDSVFYYADQVYEDFPYVKDYSHKALMWHSLSMAWSLTDRLDSALLCRIRYENYLDSVISKRSASEVVRLSALQEIKNREADYKAVNVKRNMITAFLILVIVASGVIVGLILNRRNMRHKMLAISKELELEKAKRKMVATVLSIEEKDKMLDTVRTELANMRKEGDIGEGNTRRLESAIKSHMLSHDNEETFREMFDTVNPGFTEKLRELCPDLADSYVKLASYILMNLENKRIASLMMIRPESVRQSRWRLSKRLNVPEGETLESFLRNLNKSCCIKS